MICYILTGDLHHFKGLVWRAARYLPVYRKTVVWSFGNLRIWSCWFLLCCVAVCVCVWGGGGGGGACLNICEFHIHFDMVSWMCNHAILCLCTMYISSDWGYEVWGHNVWLMMLHLTEDMFDNATFDSGHNIWLTMQHLTQDITFDWEHVWLRT